MFESNSQRGSMRLGLAIHCELSLKINVWKQFTTEFGCDTVDTTLRIIT